MKRVNSGSSHSKKVKKLISKVDVTLNRNFESLSQDDYLRLSWVEDNDGDVDSKRYESQDEIIEGSIFNSPFSGCQNMAGLMFESVSNSARMSVIDIFDQSKDSSICDDSMMESEELNGVTEDDFKEIEAVISSYHNEKNYSQASTFSVVEDDTDIWDQLEKQISENANKKASYDSRSKFSRCIRFVVQKVFPENNCKILEGEELCSDFGCNDVANRKVIFELRDQWLFEDIAPNRILHFIPLCRYDIEETCSKEANDKDFYRDSQPERIIVDCYHGLIVINPDILLSPSRISESLFCERRGVLNETLRGQSQISASGTLGSIKHEFIEGVMRLLVSKIQVCSNAEQLWGKNVSIVFHILNINSCDIDEILSQSLKPFYCSIFALDLRISDINDSLRELISPIVSTVLNLYSMHRNIDSNNHNMYQICTEDTIWCPILGLKGQIDVRVFLQDSTVNSINTGPSFPLELKTGKKTSSSYDCHRAQVIFYGLMLLMREWFLQDFKDNFSIRISRMCSVGLIVYFTNCNQDIEVIRPQWMEIVSLMQRRNNLSVYLGKSSGMSLPPVLNNSFACEKCFQLPDCMLCYSMLENGKKETSGVPNLYEYYTERNSSSQIAMFRLWNDMIDLEEQESLSKVPRLWDNLSLSSRSNGSSSIRRLSIIDIKNQDSILVYFQRAMIPSTCGSTNSSSGINIPDMAPGDKVIISVEKISSCPDDALKLKSDVESNNNNNNSSSKIAFLEPYLSSGVISYVDPTVIVVAIPKFSLDIDRLMRGIQQEYYNNPKDCFRLDRDDSYYVSSLRSSLFYLFERRSCADSSNNNNRKTEKNNNLTSKDIEMESRRQRFLSLWADLEQPEYKISQSMDSLIFCMDPQIGELYNTLNEEQRAVVKKMMETKDYLLLKGFPGSGKTRTISFLLLLMMNLDCRILLTSYTHSAIDNVLEKLKELGLTNEHVIRIGNAKDIHPHVLNYQLDLNSFDSYENYCKRISNCRIVICTVLAAARNPVVRSMDFDWCIIEEAGQILQPALFNPILQARRFMLVGDDFQLPPLVKSKKAVELGMNISLFQRFANAHPQSVNILSVQYRMNREIMNVSNLLTYDQSMICGSDSIANAKLLFRSPESLYKTPSWLQSCLNPQLSTVFLSTDYLSTDICQSRSKCGELEYSIVKMILEAFLDCQCCAKDLGLITPYCAQAKLLQESIARDFPTSLRPFRWEVSTIDKFQGRDMDIVIISFAFYRREFDELKEDILRDWRRINVAMTRAKTKLILIGSANSLKSVPAMAKVIELYSSM